MQLLKAIETPLPESDDELAIEDVSIDFPRLLPDPEASVIGGNRYINKLEFMIKILSIAYEST